MISEPSIRRDCSTADQFLEEILPRKNPVLLRRLPRQWIFRGHADTAWRLLPAALRAEKKQLPLLCGPSRDWKRIAFQVNRDQIFAEYFTVREFFDAADQRGHPLPEDSQLLREQLARYQPMPHQEARQQVDGDPAHRHAQERQPAAAALALALTAGQWLAPKGDDHGAVEFLAGQWDPQPPPGAKPF